MKKTFIRKPIIIILILTLLLTSFSSFSVSAEYTSGDFEYTVFKESIVISDYIGKDTKVTIPQKIEGLPVKHIGSFAFSNCENIEEIIIPEGVKTIGDCAFIRCYNLRSITLPKSLETIYDDAFRYCRALTDITLPDGLTEIKDGCFSNCSGLTEITIPDSVTLIEDTAFYGCEGLTSIVVPDSVKQMGNSVFADCINLSEIKLPDNMTHVGNHLVDDTAYSNNPDNWDGPALYLHTYLVATDEDLMYDGYEVKEGTTLLCRYAFTSCDNLQTVILPKSLEYIDENAFVYCRNLKEIIIPEGVKSIRTTAFECCEKLSSIFIPSSVTYISNNAFSLCPSNLKIIGIEGSYAHEYAGKIGRDFYALNKGIPYPPNVGYQIGDPDINGDINVKDATAIQKHLAGILKLHEFALDLADVDLSEDVNIRDATLIQKYAAGLL